MAENELDDLLELFLQESQDRLEELDHDLIRLEEEPSNGETLYSVLRNVHTLKGNSDLFGFTNLKDVAHRLEDLLDILKARPEAVDRGVMDILFEGGDILQTIFKHIKEGERSPELKPRELSFLERLNEVIVKFSTGGLDLKECVNTLVKQVEGVLKEFEVAVDCSHIHDSIDNVRFCLGEEKTKVEEASEENAVPLYLGEIEVTNLIQIIEKYINDNEKKALTAEEMENFFAQVMNLLKAAKSLDEPDIIEIISETEEAISTFKELELDFDEVQCEYYSQVLKSLEPYIKTKEDEDTALAESADKPEDTTKKSSMQIKKTVRIEESKLDIFLDSVGEIIILGEVFNHLQKRIATVIKDDIGLMREFKTSNTSLAQHVFSLQNSLMEVRRVELRNVMGTLGRMVRDASLSLGKNIDFVIEGEEAVIDKSLLDDISSSLVHIVRNSVDHGIELPEERLSANKPVKARIYVQAENVDGYLIIKVTDDGRGIDTAKIKSKAVELDIISKEEADKMPDNEANLLIFSEGLSTAKAVTDISGRGVGMSVVIEKIQKMGGSVEVNCVQNKGTDVILRIPLSVMLSVIEGLVLNVGNTGFIIPIRYIVETFSIQSSKIKSVQGKGEYVQLRGKLFPLLRLNNVFGMKGGQKDKGHCVVILIKSTSGQLCLLVDDIVDHQQAVIKNIGGLEKTPYILGGSLLGDGSLGLVIDAEDLIKSWKEKRKSKDTI